jgi:ubiquitin C-terminal hydrolase
MPAVMILYLCQFDSDELRQFAKNQHVITFTLEIDLRHLIPVQFDQDPNYKLTAIAKHRGIDIDHGHYIAMCRINSQWWTFDDSRVHQTGDVTDEETMLFEKIAMLFHELMYPVEM